MQVPGQETTRFQEELRMRASSVWPRAPTVRPNHGSRQGFLEPEKPLTHRWVKLMQQVRVGNHHMPGTSPPFPGPRLSPLPVLSAPLEPSDQVASGAFEHHKHNTTVTSCTCTSASAAHALILSKGPAHGSAIKSQASLTSAPPPAVVWMARLVRIKHPTGCELNVAFRLCTYPQAP